MTVRNLTESESHLNPVTTFVPLFKDEEKIIGIHVKAFERFGAWSFEMESDLRNCNSLIGELFTGLCRTAGLQRRIICAIDLEIGRRDEDYEFICIPSGALACGDFGRYIPDWDCFTIAAVYVFLI